MHIRARLDRLEAQINVQREKEMTGVIFYDVWNGEFRGAYKHKPGQTHTRKMVEINGIPRPEGFRGTLIINDVPRSRNIVLQE